MAPSSGYTASTAAMAPSSGSTASTAAKAPSSGSTVIILEKKKLREEKK
jgi:hypothetical protein